MESRLPLASVSRIRMQTDGEGVTTLVSAYGCRLHCKYCINEHLIKYPKECNFVTCEELYEKVKIDHLYFLATNGGLTFGGGESLLQADFLTEFIKKYRSLGWRFTAETSLNVPREMLKKVLPWMDSYIVDIKTMNPDIYYRYTGFKQSLAIENLRYLLTQVEPNRVRVKVPRIPGYNDESDVKESVRKLQAFGVTKISAFDYVIPEEYRKERAKKNGRTECH